MQRFYIVLGISIISQLVIAQNFKRASHFYPIVGLYNSSAVFEDINGDGYTDLLISGMGREHPPMTNLYLNDGQGNFLEKTNTPFDDVHFSAMAIADVNGDSYVDIMISGSGSSYTLPTKLYLNDGAGNFSEMSDFPTIKIWKGAMVLEDINGDTHPDMIISGRKTTFFPTTRMFVNDGAGHFTEVKESSLVDVYDCSIAIADANKDGHADVLIAGLNRNDEPITKLYMNDGVGNFTELANSSFVGISEGSVALEDMNGDGYPEILVSGTVTSFYAVTKLYINDGQGNFMEAQENTFFKGFHSSMATVEDIDSDGHSDVLINGRRLSGAQFTKSYLNDGQGNFTEKKDHLIGLIKGFMTTTDVNNDGHSDILIGGRPRPSDDPITKLYLNDGNGNFSEKEETLTGVYDGCIAVADINGDHQADLFIAGINNAIDKIATLHIKEEAGHFTKVRRTPFKGTINSFSIADVNGDKYPDVLVTGWYGRAMTKLYLNDGAGLFSEMKGTSFVGVAHGSGVLADVNGDVYPDVLISGNIGDSLITKLYLNDSNGEFTETKDSYFLGTELNSIAVADVTGDEYPDIFISGFDEDGNPTTDLYTNDSLGHFKQVMDTPFIGGDNSIVTSDINNDGFVDVFIAGRYNGYSATKLYTNDGFGHFTEVEDTSIEEMHDNSVAVGDLNDDGLPDVIAYGNDGLDPILKLYMNEGENKFTEISDHPFTGLIGSTITLADVNGDSRPDVLIAGENSSSVFVTHLYINEGSK